jgi:uncharacterized small protein (DUF1192 family)
MLEDDPFTAKPKPAAPLETLSVADLEARIAALQAEIAVCETLAAKKRGHLAAADLLFGAKRP